MTKRRWIWIAGSAGAVAAVGTVVLIARSRQSTANTTTPSTTTTNTSGSATSSASNAASTRSSAPAFLSWSKATAYTEESIPIVGPGPGNQPNGSYQIAARFTAPTSGRYQLSLWADDWATVAIDGSTIGSTSMAWRTGIVSLSAGVHQLVATVTNNDLGDLRLVPYQSGTANPTGFGCKLISPSGGTILTTTTASGWYYSGYTRSLQVSTIHTDSVPSFGAVANSGSTTSTGSQTSTSSRSSYSTGIAPNTTNAGSGSELSNYENAHASESAVPGASAGTVYLNGNPVQVFNDTSSTQVNYWVNNPAALKAQLASDEATGQTNSSILSAAQKLGLIS